MLCDWISQGKRKRDLKIVYECSVCGTRVALFENKQLPKRDCQTGKTFSKGCNCKGDK